jgi:hypothetical protein
LILINTKYWFIVNGKEIRMAGKKGEKTRVRDKPIGRTPRAVATGSGTAGSLAVTSLPVTTIQTLPVIGDLTPVELIANGRAYIVQVEPNWTLRDVLREKLGLTSIKDFCSGYGACGSCTVIMDGRPVLSCTVLAIECDGAVIETA